MKVKAMAGLGDQAGNVVKEITHGLQATPTCLAAVLLAAFFSTLTYFSLYDDKHLSQERFKAVIDLCWANKNIGPNQTKAPPDFGGAR